jgi:predicted RNase H-like nuclease
MTTLLVGFDSAWTPTNRGSIVAVLYAENGETLDLGPPQIVNYDEAESVILQWQAQHLPQTTIVLLDQPTIVANATGQRPVENLVSSPVSLRYGGVQPANTGREVMFGKNAPIWSFLRRFGGPADPLQRVSGTHVYETYPVLAMIALGWLLPDSRATGRLPKYNPGRKKTFSIADWQYVCALAADSFRKSRISGIAVWLDNMANKPIPGKSDQDGLDACLCLLVALHLIRKEDCLMLGNLYSGYILVPFGDTLFAELQARCQLTDRTASEWLEKFRLTTN